RRLAGQIAGVEDIVAAARIRVWMIRWVTRALGAANEVERIEAERGGDFAGLAVVRAHVQRAADVRALQQLCTVVQAALHEQRRAAAVQSQQRFEQWIEQRRANRTNRDQSALGIAAQAL